MVRTFEEKVYVTKKEASQVQSEKKKKGVKVCLFLFIFSKTLNFVSNVVTSG
jgi:hypothetical protein